MSTHPVVQKWVHGDPPPEPDPYAPVPEPDAPKLRRVDLTPASQIKPKRVRWIWKDRLAVGTLGLLAGREGLGKSTLAYDLASDVTRGTLPGEYYGTPRAVIVCASEDSWEHTIVPRLIAAGADLDLVYRAEIVTHNDLRLTISLPRDFTEVEQAALAVNAALLVLDPLMSVIDSRLDTHRDREVRQALEPLKTLAERSHMSILGLIHHNKSGSTDALQLVMGSKAFSAVARSVHTCIPDPDDETQERRLFATSKNNLGRLDLPVLGFTITGHAVETEDDGIAWTGRLKWTGEVAGAMHEIMTRASDPERTATTEAADWLQGYLSHYGGESSKTEIEKAGRSAGHTPATLRRARERLRLEYRSEGFPRTTYWSLPGAITKADEQLVDVTEPRRTADTTGPDDTTGDTTAEAVHSRVNDQPTLPVVPVVSEGDTTVTPLGLTSGNVESASRAYARAGGDDTTDTTDSLTPLHNPSRASRASRDMPPHVRAHTRELTPDSDLPPPLCDDCGYPIDTTHHATTCEEP